MGFTRGLAAEVGAHGVTANCVSLGTMKTGALAEALEPNPELEQQARPALPDPPARRARRPGRRSWRCSAATPARWITGQVYPVDGGYVSAL